MTTAIKRRRGTTAQHSTFTGLEGELTIDTTKDTVVVHDGVTAGGFPLAKESVVTALDSAAVHKTGDETLAGTKTFTSTITGNISGNAGTVTNGVYTTGDQTIGGTKTLSSNPVLSSGTANGVAYLNGSKVLTTGSALTFDDTNLATTGNMLLNNARYYYGKTSGGTNVRLLGINSGNSLYIGIDSGPNDMLLNASSSSLNIQFLTGGSEQMRLTSTGLGIGTSSPSAKLDVLGSKDTTNLIVGAPLSTVGGGAFTNYSELLFKNTAGSNSDASIRAYGNVWNTAGSQLAFFTSSNSAVTERMRLDSSGNLGLGVTPSAWSGIGRTLQINTGGAISADIANTYFSSNSYYNGSNWIYQTTNNATRYTMATNFHAWFTAPSGTAGDAISFTQAMTLDASGFLSIGTTSAYDSATALTVYRASSCTTALGNGTVQSFQNVSSDRLAFGTLSNHNLAFYTNSTERMRIDSSGNVLVGVTAFANASGGVRLEVGTSVSNVSTSAQVTTPWVHWRLYNANGNVGNVSTDGSSTTYATSSDYRLKENVQPMQDALAVVQQLNPVTYTWKADGSDGQGFIAHELQAVVPDCVTGEKDAVDEEGKPIYQGIDTSFLVATLTKAIQELKAELDATKAEVAALKGA